jgi:hypothetical protein
MLRGLQNLQVVCHQKGACKHGISVSLVPDRAVLFLWWLDGLYRLPAVDVGGKITMNTNKKLSEVTLVDVAIIGVTAYLGYQALLHFGWLVLVAYVLWILVLTLLED